MTSYFIAGGAGFIGSHLVRLILKSESDARIKVYDNFSSGRQWHLDSVAGNPALEIVRGDIKDIDLLTVSMKAHDIVYHFASNPDISKAVTQPDIDFWDGTYLTNNILESMRINGIKNLMYASGSGVYGDTGYNTADENYSPLTPISTYGASKLACESLISSYCYMFDMNAAAFRFANVVGPNQTHGVGYDFIRKLLKNDKAIQILGDGNQSKSYIYVDDVLSAMRLIEKDFLKGFSYFNVATNDYITVKEIADIVVKTMKLTNVKYQFTGGDRGWKGDVPVVRLDSDKIRKLGWKNNFTSFESIEKSVHTIYKEAKQNKINRE